MRPTILTSLMLIASHGALASHHFQRNIISDLVSAASTLLAGGGEDTATPTSTTLKGPPATATPPNSKTTGNTQSSTAVVSTTLTKSTITASTASSGTITSSATTTTTASSSSSTITSSNTSSNSTTSSSLSSSSSSSSSATPVPSNPANAAPSPSPVPSEQGGISGAGIAVAVILSLFILGVIAWLIFRYHPRSRAWWAARQEKKFQERSYRDALDGPGAGTKQSRLRGALGPDGRKSTYLASFFAPRTVNLGDGKEIRRKPVQWGVKPGEEKVPLTNMASPMGRSPVSPLSALEKPLPTPTIADRTTRIYELP